MEIDLAEIRELIAIVNQSNVTELVMESEDFKLTIRKAGMASTPVATIASGPAPQEIPVAATSTIPAVPATPTEALPVEQEHHLLEVKAPMVGTFYRAPSPEASPFVQLNDRIGQNQTVCIIEAMKLMNEIEAEVSGRIVEICVKNGEPVEFGQILMRVDPK
ncbi:MAG: acetyl-CoA carboxylase biotin carboxyl carrier protein [Gloeobacterales cyanobacterium]